MLTNLQNWCEVLSCPVCLGVVQASHDEKYICCVQCGFSFRYNQNIPVIVENTQILAGLKESLEFNAQIADHHDKHSSMQTSDQVKSRVSTLLEKHAVIIQPHHNILEIGSGPFESLHDVTGNVKVSIDPLATSYRDQISSKREKSNIIQGLAEILPFRDNLFDVLISSNSFDRLKNPDLAILEFNRVLKSDGICIIECYVDSDPFILHEPFVLTERFVINYISKYFYIISSKRIPHPKDFAWDWIELKLKPKMISLSHRPFSAGIFQEIAESYIELYAKGSTALEHGKFDEAIEFLKRSLEKHPHYFWNSLMITEAYLKSGQYLAASEYLTLMRERILSGYYPYVQSPEKHIQRLLQAIPQKHPSVVYSQDKVKAIRILLIVCLYENNFGDFLIYQTVRSKLEESGFEVDIYEISQSLFSSDFFVKADNCNFIYFVGGGIIERGAPDIVRHFDQVYSRLNVPYGIIGLSTGEFDYSAFAQSLQIFCDNAAFFFTRDTESVETFRKYGGTRLPIASADVVFANLQLPAIQRSGTDLTANFRNIPYPDITGDIDWLAWSASLKRIGVQYLLGDCSSDQAQLGIQITNNDIVQDITRSGLIVAMRFHVILVAALLGIPSIPITYCPKVRRLAQQLGLSDYCLNIHDHDKLEEVSKSLISNYQATTQALTSNVSLLRQIASCSLTRSIDVIKEIVNG